MAVAGTLFFTTLDSTFAIDAANCKLRWKQTQPLSAAERVGLGVNRGVAFADGKVFRGFDDGSVMAIAELEHVADAQAPWSEKKVS